MLNGSVMYFHSISGGSTLVAFGLILLIATMAI